MSFRQIINLKSIALFAVTGVVGLWLATTPLATGPAHNAYTDGEVVTGLQAHPVALDTTKTPMVTSAALDVSTSDLLWTGDIPLTTQGPETVENVTIAAGALDMATVHPNETFSFNNRVGIRSEEKGYLSGLMYSNGEVVRGIGGGICIVSTLLYRAALESGMKMLERHPHSGPVSYAEPGHDAAVAYGSADLSFKNTTGAPMMIRATVQDNELTIRLYGKQQNGRSYKIITEDYEELPYKIFETPDPTLAQDQVEVDQKARPGWVVTTVRLTMKNGKEIGREVISHDTVLPRNKKMRIPVSPEPEVQPTPGSGETPATVHQAVPKSGIIHVPDLDHKAPPSEEPEASDGKDLSDLGKNLSTSERTVSSARE